MKVRLIAVTQPLPFEGGPTTADELLVYTARVSSPQNQANRLTGPKLLKYCMDHKHWSVFSQASMTVEVETSRAISAQILRHDFEAQEFSQRYADASELGFENIEPRRQDTKNRQNSFADLDEETKSWFQGRLATNHTEAECDYMEALERGIAKESARFLLPMSTRTRLYLHGTCRLFIHYLQVRTHESTQKEHRDVALEIQKLFKQVFPSVAAAMETSK